MEINATLIGQFITFAILIWFTMKYVWPPVTKAMEDREKKIAEGLEAAERSKRELVLAEQEALSIVRKAKQEATQIIEQASLHSAQMIEEAKSQANIESQRIIDLAQGEIDKDVLQAREKLKNHLATLAIAGAEKILQRSVDLSTQTDLLNKLVTEI